MIRKLGEYISVRDKEQMIKKIDSGARLDLMYEHKNFLNGKGIIIKKKNRKISSCGHDKQEHNTKECIHNWIDGRKKRGMKWLQILDEMKKIYFEKSQKTQDLSPLTKSPIEIKDVHIEFDDLHNNDIQNGKLFYII